MKKIAIMLLLREIKYLEIAWIAQERNKSKMR